ncbi:hypothetical protein ES705_18472 [subsurface metagenome]
MNRWLLTIALIVICLSVTVNKASACNVSPWASICPVYKYYENIPVGEPARFALAAGDPDGDIAEWRVDFDDFSTPESGSGSPPSYVTHEYSNAGIYNPTLWVLDNGSSPCSAIDYCVVYVVKVYEVYEGVWNQGFNHGPVYLSLCQMAHLWALPYPGDWENWPDGEPTWDVYDQPSGANAKITVDPSYDDEVDITNLSFLGNYYIEADCGDSTDDITITAFLPSGCYIAGQHDSSVHWINPNDDYRSETIPTFGSYNKNYATQYDDDFKYSSGKWKCQISNVVAQDRILVRYPFSLLPDNVSVESAADVPCDEAEFAKYDLDDTNLADDVGPPYCKYWCYTAVIAHEECHREDWRGFYEQTLSEAITTLERDCFSYIDCGDPDTVTCQAAKTYWQLRIRQFFSLAFIQAATLFNNPDTTLDEAEQRAYNAQYIFDHPISAALPEGCTP